MLKNGGREGMWVRGGWGKVIQMVVMEMGNDDNYRVRWRWRG